MRLTTSRPWMLFVDGENFTRRGQEVLKGAGVDIPDGARWQRDVYLWVPHERARWSVISGDYVVFLPRGGAKARRSEEMRRAHYYTSRATGDPEWTDAHLAIREMGFEPHVFPRRQGRSKAVDIALATDVLTLAASHQYDAAIIVAGDGDYLPVIESVKRLGLYVGVAFFGDTTNKSLRIAADEYLDITQPFIDAWRGPTLDAGDPE